jgi:threonyl-tRNA synthetase
MAEAIVKLFPQTKLVYGPPVENGFYYDIDLDRPLSSDDFPAIEREMQRVVDADLPLRRLEFSREAAAARVAGDAYKTENLNAVPPGETISFYVTGEPGTGFEDLCRGPHVPSTGKIGAFKLMQISGAYLHGDETQKQLQRVYGTAWPTKKALEAYLERLRLAQERDHRKLGQELEIFMISDDVGRGLALWLPNGTVIRQELQRLAEEVEFRAGYKRVATPHITRAVLYHRSGHLPYYKDSMYPPMALDDDEYYLKPMNCPHHHMIYASRPRSYRELPLRLAEYGQCYRYEKSGELAGLLRVRGMCMNDAHIYCTPDQVKDEFRATIEMSRYYYGLLRIKDFWLRLSLHDRDKSKYIANAAMWEASEIVVEEVLKESGIPYHKREGEAAFYGPKIDYQMRNVIGREETASTTQLDFAVPERFGLEFIAPDGSRQRPYIIHRAPLGTHERFIAFLLEHFGGAFPTWLAPVQVAIIPVAKNFAPYAEKLRAELHERLIRVEVDDGPDQFKKKIRNAVVRKIPNIFVVGGKEEENASVTWRRYCVEKQVTLKFADAAAALRALHADRTMDNFPDVNPPGWNS